MVFEKTYQDKKTGDAFLKQNNIESSTTSIQKGYVGAVTMILASHQWSPASKLSYFNKGKQLLEDAILNDNRNTELRFLRYCIQMKSPQFLGYNKQLESDKAFILRHLHTTDNDLKNRITTFFSRHG